VKANASLDAMQAKATYVEREVKDDRESMA
jgi:hypothetical protein